MVLVIRQALKIYLISPCYRVTDEVMETEIRTRRYGVSGRELLYSDGEVNILPQTWQEKTADWICEYSMSGFFER